MRGQERAASEQERVRRQELDVDCFTESKVLPFFGCQNTSLNSPADSDRNSNGKHFPNGDQEMSRGNVARRRKSTSSTGKY